MRESKFSLADLLIVLGAVGYGFFCFMGLNFRTLGDTKQSVILAVIFALILGGFALGAKMWKRTSRNFKSSMIWEWTFLLLFVSFSILFFKPFSHYFTVMGQKEEIKEEMSVNINQAKSMFDEYEEYTEKRLDIYESRLNSVVKGKAADNVTYKNYGFTSGTSDAVQVENKTFVLKSKLYPSNYEDAGGIKTEATNWLSKAESTLKNRWAFTFGVVDIVNDAKEYSTDWKNKLVEFSEFRADGETTTSFDYELTINDVTKRIEDYSESHNMFAFILAILFFLLMLFSYIITKRHSRFAGFAVTFGIKKDGTTLSNEL